MNNCEDNLKEAVLQSIEEASMCWSEIPRGIFDLDEATAIAKRLYEMVLIESSLSLAEARFEHSMKIDRYEKEIHRKETIIKELLIVQKKLKKITPPQKRRFA